MNETQEYILTNFLHDELNKGRKKSSQRTWPLNSSAQLPAVDLALQETPPQRLLIISPNKWDRILWNPPFYLQPTCPYSVTTYVWYCYCSYLDFPSNAMLNHSCGPQASFSQTKLPLHYIKTLLFHVCCKPFRWLSLPALPMPSRLFLSALLLVTIFCRPIIGGWHHHTQRLWFKSHRMCVK